MCDVAKLKLKKRCGTPNEPSILYVVKDGVQCAVCEACWKRIAEGDWQIGDDKPLTMKEITDRRIREEKAGTPTEYKYRGVIENSKENEDEDDYPF